VKIKSILKKILFVIALLLHIGIFAQTQQKHNDFKAIDAEIFADDSHHWYGIFDKSNVINPSINQPRYQPTELTAIADNILLYQKDNGGWPKNYDMFAILTPAQKDSLIKVKPIPNTTFDNGTTYSHVACLADVYKVTKVEKYKESAQKGLDYIMAAQYDNGGWPQYYPLENNYSRHITYNDDVYAGIMKVLKDITDGKATYDFVDANHRIKIKASYEKGLACILKTQINDNGKPTAWCQQHDEVTLQPAWARTFEPPSICNRESVEIVLLLMSITNPSKEIIESVQNAVTWFNASKIFGIVVKTLPAPVMVTKFRISKTDKVVVKDPKAPPIWTRYYELKTHRPLFCNREMKIVYSLAEVDRERRDGYGWYTYEPQKVLNAYSSWQQKWAKDKNVLQQ
jgi:PelA/Pel-15E family pectate lyase